MLTPQDRRYAKKRKAKWDTFNLTYKGVNDLSNNGSLNCGCIICKLNTYYRRVENKKAKLRARRELKLEISLNP